MKKKIAIGITLVVLLAIIVGFKPMGGIDPPVPEMMFLVK